MAPISTALVATKAKTNNQPDVFTSFHPGTGTWQYLVSGQHTSVGVIIDSVLDFDPVTNRISTETADTLLNLVAKHDVKVQRIMETHAHADHLTAARYLQAKLFQRQQSRPNIWIGKRILQVQSTVTEKYEIDTAELIGVFDQLFDDNEKFPVGSIPCEAFHLPGHIPDHIGYKIGHNVFTGDSIFNPDVGSARADFPGSSASDLYRSARALLSLPGHYRFYTVHDYPPESRTVSETGGKHKPYTTVAEQNESNKHIKAGTPKIDFVKWRSERDSTLGEPKLLHQAPQFNIRAGGLPRATSGGEKLLKSLSK